MGVGRGNALRVEFAKVYQLLLPPLAPLPSQACTRRIKQARKTKKTKKPDASSALPGEQQDPDLGHSVMKVLVKPLRLVDLA